MDIGGGVVLRLYVASTGECEYLSMSLEDKCAFLLPIVFYAWTPPTPYANPERANIKSGPLKYQILK